MAQPSGDKSESMPTEPGISEALAPAQKLTHDRKLIVASNRGPLYFSENHSGQLTPKRDSSRSTEMFDPLVTIPIHWVAGAVGSADRQAADTQSDESGVLRSAVLPNDWTVRFVSPPRRVHHKFYNVICNPLLWFMLHRSWSPTFTPNIGSQEHDAWEKGYRAVNESFAANISEAASTDEFALICRDYQLMLVPGIVRSQHPDAVIHQSFETPWPWPNDFEVLPTEWRVELLESLLAADVLSFPTTRDADAFVACVSSNLEIPTGSYDSHANTYELAGRKVRLNVSPPSVRSSKFAEVTEFPQTKRFVEDLDDDNYAHTFVTVDRAEPHKNIIRSINAYGDLLKQNQELSETTRFLLFLTPGPAHISAYKRLSDEIRRSARRINEKYRHSNPVKVYEESNFYRSVAALSIYDTLVSVPLVDGTSRSVLDGPLVNTRNGGMILSENSAASGLFADNVSVVSFADTQAISDAMASAISESPQEREDNSTAIRAEIASMNPDQEIDHIIQSLAE